MATDDALQRLRQRLDPYLSEVADWSARFNSGRPVDEPLAAIRARYPGFGDREVFLHVSEAAAATHADPEEPRRLKALRRFLAEELCVRASQDADDQIARFEREATVPLGEETLSFRAARARLPHESSRQRRTLLEKSLGDLLFAHTGPFAQRIEAQQRTADRLGFSSARALFEETAGFALQPLLDEAELTLERTEDAYRDLLAYFLKKLDATARPLPASGARRHDLFHLATGAFHAEHFRPEDLWQAVAGAAAQLGLPPDAEHHIRADTEKREGMRRHSFAAEVRVPESIWLAVGRPSGLDGVAGLLRALGCALQSAQRAAQGTAEDRRLGDPSVPAGFATNFELLAADEQFLRRVFHLGTPVAREVARLAAFNALTALRARCAMLPYELTLLSRGGAQEISDEYEERLRHALFVPVHRGFFLAEHRPFFQRAHQLRGDALEAVLHAHLRERFNEDYFRNPAAGRFLASLFAFGNRQDAAALAETVGGKLELTGAGARLVRILNA